MGQQPLIKPAAFDWKKAVVAHRGNLPHVRQDRVIYFVTFRLGDSISVERRNELLDMREMWLKANPKPHTSLQEKEYREIWTVRIENLLDCGMGSCVLRNDKARIVLEETMKYEDGVKYALGEFVIMPNHVHALICMAGEYRLSDTIGTWKSVSSRRIGGGPIWMEEYFDHAVRSEGDLIRFIEYIRKNPRHLKTGEFTVGHGSLY